MYTGSGWVIIGIHGCPNPTTWGLYKLHKSVVKTCTERGNLDVLQPGCQCCRPSSREIVLTVHSNPGD